MKLQCTILTFIFFTFTSLAANKCIGIKGGLSLFNIEYVYPHNDNSTPFDSPDYNSNYNHGYSGIIFGEIQKNRYFYHNLQISFYQGGGIDKSDLYDAFGNVSGIYQHTIVLNNIGIGYNFGVKAHLLKIIPYTSIGISVDYLASIQEYFSPDSWPFKSIGFNHLNLRPLLTAGLEYKFSALSVFCEYIFSFNLFPVIYEPSYYNTENGNGIVMETVVLVKQLKVIS